MLVLAAALFLGSCDVASEPEPSTTRLPNRDFTLVLPIYDDMGLAQATTTLKPLFRREDRFMVVSGNNSAAVDPEWANRTARELRTHYPHARLYAATSGLDNLEKAVRQMDRIFEAVVYIYEPNFSNQPEFSWDFGETLGQFRKAGVEAKRRGFRAVGKPTGRPLLQPGLTDYGWDYGTLSGAVDELLIQTQTYCEDGVEVFARAISKISRQYGAQNRVLPWFPQITVAPDAPNGTSVERATACLDEAREGGVDGTVWWSPQAVAPVVAFMEHLNRQP